MLNAISAAPCCDVTSLLAKVNETVLTDAQGSGLIGSPSDISPPYPSQKAISLATGKLKAVNTVSAMPLSPMWRLAQEVEWVGW